MDAGDLVTFAIVVENTGSSPNGAFDLLIQDNLPTGFVVPEIGVQGINLRVTSGVAGNQLPFQIVGGSFFGQSGGLRLIDPTADRGAIGPAATDGSNIVIVTYDLRVADTVRVLETITNVGEVENYAGQEGGPDFTGPDALTDPAVVVIANESLLAKQLVGTEIVSPSPTGSINSNTEAVIGEFVTYRVTLTVPEATMPNAVLTDLLDPELAFVALDSAVLSSGVSITGSTTPVVTNNGRNLQFNLGTITNSNRDNAVTETITLTYRAVVVNTSASNANDRVNNSARFTFTGLATAKTAAAPTVTIIEPQVKIEKSVSVAGGDETGDAGDPFVYTIVLSNPPGQNQFTADAYDVTFFDRFGGAVGAPTTITGFTVTDTAGLVTAANFQLLNTFPQGTRLVTAPGGEFDMLVDATRTITIRVTGTINQLLQPGRVIPNTAEVRWTSLDGNPGERSPFTTASTERTGVDGAGGLNDYLATDRVDIIIINPELTKTVVATSENATTDPTAVTVGEIIRYRVVLAIPEFGQPTSLQLVDLLPVGVQLTDELDGRIALVDDEGFLSASNLEDPDPNAPPALLLPGDESNVQSLVPEFPIPQDLLTFETINGRQQVTFDLGLVTNPPSADDDFEFIVVEFDALVLNTPLNQAGAQRENEVTVIQGGSPLPNPATVTLRVAEPAITGVDKSVVSPLDRDAPDSQAHDAGDQVHFAIRYSNDVGANVSTAYDVRLIDPLPSAKMTLDPASIAVFRNGVQITTGFTINPSGDTVDVTVAEVAPGDFIGISYVVTLTTAVEAGEIIPNTANLTWTSLPGSNGTTDNPTGSVTPGAPGSDTGERDGSGGVNDYAASDDAAVEILAPQLDKAIVGSNDNSTTFGQFNPDLTDLGIGETVVYQLTITLPEGTTNLDLTDLLPFGPDGVLGLISVRLADNIDNTFPLDASQVTTQLLDRDSDGVFDGFTVDFGTQVNPPDGVLNNRDRIIFNVLAQVLDVPQNVADKDVTNTAIIDWGRGTLSDSVTAEIVEPVLDVTKEVVGTTQVDAGDVVTYRVTVRHAPTSTSIAYDVNLTDALPAGLELVPGSPRIVYAPDYSSIGVLPPTFQVTGNTLTFTAAGLDHPDSPVVPNVVDEFIFEYQARVTATALPGQPITNTQNMTYRSASDGFELLYENFSRPYTDSDPAAVTVNTNSISGVVYHDTNNNGAYEPGTDTLITTSVTMRLTGTDHIGNSVSVDVMTVGGEYSFTGLRPSDASGYTIAQVDQPATFIDGIDTPGTSSPGTQFGGTGTAATDSRNPRDAEAITGIVIGTGGTKSGINYNFGEILPATIGDFVWEDTNGNGRQDTGELGIPNVTVTLIGIDDTGNAVNRPTQTGLLGGYTFDNVRPGTYQVVFTAPSGFVFTVQDSAVATDATDSDADRTSGQTASFTIIQGQSDPTRDAGLYRPLTVGDFVWYDINGDGVQDLTEPGIPGAIVTLVGAGPDDTFGTADDQSFGTQTTDASGLYTFTNVAPGTLRATTSNVPAGLTVPTFDLDGTATANQATFTAVSGTNRDDVDFGFRGNASISGFVYRDLDNDGIFDAGETPIEGVEITLTGTDELGGSVSLTTTTLADGSYSFANLAAGSYVLTEPTQPAGLLDGRDTPGTPFGGTGTLGGNPRDADAITGIVIPASGIRTGVNYNFGELPPAIVGDFVWEDTNGNGRQDAGEPGLDGVTVTLSGTDDLGPVSASAMTAGGLYSFPNLRPGSYQITFTPPSGYVFTVPDSPVATDATDSDAAPATGQTAAFTLVAGQSDPTRDAGLYRPASVGDFVWYDVNADGIQDSGEPGMPGVRLFLDDAGLDNTFGTADDATAAATTLTDGVGGYLFAGLRPGVYRVRVVPITLPNGITAPTFDRDGIATAHEATLTLSTGQDVRDADFGYTPPQLAALGDRVWYDSNANGIDDNEPGIAGVTVTAVWFGFDDQEGTGDDVTYPAVTTDNDGNYGFLQLPFGTFRVTVDRSTISSAAVPTYDLDSGTNNPDDTTLATLTLLRPTELGADFGYFVVPAFGDRIWLDYNGDGVQDSGEPGIPGVTVTAVWAGNDDLFNTGDEQTFTRTTGTLGRYVFLSTPPGEYRVSVTGGLPPAVTNTGDPDLIKNGATAFTLGDNQIRLDIDFGYQGNNSLAGFVYRDFNVNGLREPNGPKPETGIGGVTITLRAVVPTGAPTGMQFTVTTATAADGSYFFDGLPDGAYQIIETQPDSVFTAGAAGYYDGLDTLGSAGGTNLIKNQFSVVFTADIDGVEYNFGENPPADPFGFVYQDLNVNGRLDTGEPGIPGVAVTISGTAFPGTPLERPLTPADIPGGALTAFTDASGQWEFPIVPPGVYSLVETQPAGFLDGDEEDADPNGPPATVGNDRFDNVVLDPFPIRGPFNFGERVIPGPPGPLPPFPPPPPVDPSKRDFLGSTTPRPTPLELSLNPNFAEFGAPATRAIGFAAVAQDVGGGMVRVFDFMAGNERFRFQPFGEFTGGVRVTTVDITRDGIPDIVAVPGPGGGPIVRVFDGNTGAPVFSLMAFDPAFRGGLFVAAADFNGDLVPDLAVTPDTGGGPIVTLFDGRTGAALSSFLALDENFRGGLRLAAGDVNADGTPDLLVTAGEGGGPRVAGYDGRTLTSGAPARLFNDFLAFAPELRTGFWIASGDVDGDGFADVALGAGLGGAPRVVVYNGQALATGGGPVSISSFFAGDPEARSGARVAVADLEADGRPELLAAGGAGTWPVAYIFDPVAGTRRDGFYAFPSDFPGGVFIG